MGRKIPAKKHRGVKDPVKQQEQRLKSLKGKINAAPRDPDEQPVPRSLLKLFGLPDPADARKPGRAVRKPAEGGGKSNRSGAGSGSGEADGRSNPVSRLRRMPAEDARAFSLRINSALRLLHHPSADLYPTGLDEAADVKGAAMAERRERRARKRARQGRGRGAEGEEGEEGEGERPARAHALTLRKKAKKEKQVEAARAAARELRYERLPFGERAAAPPALPAPRRAAPAPAGGARPGRRQLLLHALLGGAPPPAPGPRRPPPAAAAEAERARLQAVAAYRALRKQKLKLNP